MADITAWDTRHYLQLLRRQAERLRDDPSIRHLRFNPDELAAETLARAKEANTPASSATTERDRLAWLLRLEKDILYALCDHQNGKTATWAGKERDDGLRVVGQALLNSTAVWDGVLREATSSDDEDAPAPFDKYTDFKLVSSGGMGAVFRCRDKELGRVVAMKIMHRHLLQQPHAVRDFHEEAQVASQLQHPNVAPVHERGKTPDGRPYFTMRLIQGRTWADAFAEHHSKPGKESLNALLKQFLAVCETVGFAHKKDVLHRDLKPLNVMVGPFGEVQVMDWGLSKVLPGGGNHSTVVRVDNPEATRAGAIRGTFAYMPPEQADPKRGPVDKRSDVFGLGAMLCEILTGRPPYTSNEIDRQTRSEDLWAQARECQTATALKRLDASGAPPELIRLVRRCLSSKPDERPDDADVVSRIMERYFEKQEEDERSGEIKHATRVERKKKKIWLVLAGLAIALAAAAAIGGYFVYAAYMAYKKTTTGLMAQDVINSLEESEKLQKEAAGMPTETSREAEEALQKSQKSLEAAVRAQSLLKEEVADEHRAQVAAMVAAAQLRVKEAEGRLALARRNEKLLADLAASERLAAVRLVGFRPDFDTSKAAFAKAFHDYGIDVLAGEPVQSAEKLKAVPEKRRGELVRGIDYWAVIDKESRGKLRVVADHLDDNAWRRDFRQALDKTDDATLLRLAGDVDKAIAAGETDILGDALRERNKVDDAVTLLRNAEKGRRKDYWIQMSLGISLCQKKPPDFVGASASFKAAASIEEKSAAAASNYALSLMRMGEVEQAVNQMRAAVALQESSAPLQCNLAVVLNSQRLGNPEAKKAAERARELDPNYEEATAVLALCKLVEGDKTGAKNLLDKLSPKAQDTPVPLFCRMILALATIPPKERDAAKYARRLHTVDPRSEAGLFAHVLAEVLDGDTLAAEKAANELIAECPYGIWEALGETIRAEVIMYQGRLREADDALNAALRRKDLPTAHDARFKLRLHQGRFEEAAEELKLLKAANKDVAILNTLYQVNQFLLDGAMKIDRHMAAIASGKEKESEIFRNMIAEAALLRGKTRLARDQYGKMMTDKPGLEKFNSHGSSVVCSYEGVSHRTNAARASIRLANGEGTDLGTVTDADRSLARKDALHFLRSDFEFKARLMTEPIKDLISQAGIPGVLVPIAQAIGDQFASRERYRRWLIFCLNCDDFKSMRNQNGLATLPEAERKLWTELWEDMRVALKNVPEPPPVSKPKGKKKD